MPLDVDFVRSQFPAFREPSLEGFAHFENAGGSFAAGAVIDRLGRYYRETKVQPYYAFAPSARAGALMDSAKERLAAWLNVGKDEVHFGPSTSQNTYVLAQALRRWLRPGDEIIVTNQDHEANVGAWSRLADDGFTVREWKVNPATAELERAGLEELLGPRTKLVAFTHCSNLVGSINAVREFTDLAHAAGAFAFVDGVALAPHGLPDLAALGVDAYYFSLYKVYGPHLGALFLRREVNAALPNQGHFFNDGKPGARFTPAGPDHAQIAAVNGVVDYLETVAAHHGLGQASVPARAAAVRGLFRAHETALLQPLLDWLAAQPKVRLIGRRQAADRAPTVSIAVKGRAAAEIGAKLADANIGVGVGSFYAYRLARALGMDPDDGAVRLSFVHYTTQGEVDRLMRELDRCLN
ncbi:MAG TPA: aminotransferase class V-fold PLP-dependent enzyme [Steroidobacteraceae bacterium]|jgi:cysteine desulfurase family protein (TIGR01976 family)|nr:aminotransferase class V-fold PLP-dependent enzyme [Steroidobacteraceae bacterium]